MTGASVEVAKGARATLMVEVLESTTIEDAALESTTTEEVTVLSIAVVLRLPVSTRVDEAAMIEEESTTWLA